MLQILSKIFSDARYRNINDQIVKWSSSFGIDQLSAGWVGSDRLESDFVDSTLNKSLSLALAGLGSKQALTMLVQLFLSNEGDMILIEEPEINLHPEAQITLPSLFTETIRAGKNLVMTTHTEFLILAFSKPIREGALNRNDLGIYNLEKTKNGTQIKRLAIAENGYIENWIPSFTRVESELLNEFLKSVPEE